MATSQQGKRKKKVLSQQQIDKLLGMLQEEDKPLRAGILARTLGYQSARDINPTLVRLEGYGTVSRVIMNNTPLWKYVGTGVAPGALACTDPSDGAGVHLRLPQHHATENGGPNATVIVEAKDDSCPSRPQSTKADLEWDPTDIQAHCEENGVHGDNGNTVNTDFCQLYTNDSGSTSTGTTMYINSQHGIPNGLISVNQTNNSNSVQMNGNGITEGLGFTATSQGYASQDLYSAMDSSRLEQMSVHNMNINGMEGDNGGSFVGSGGEYIGMSAYNGNGDVNLGGGGIPTNGYNLEYAHQNSQNDANHGGAHDMYMMSSSNLRHMTNGIGGNSMASSNLQNFSITANQVHSEYAQSNNYNSSITSAGMAQKMATSAGQSMQQNYNSDGHSHNHYYQNSYPSSSNNIGRMPTYVVQEIIKPESVGQYGMACPQGEARTVGGYQSLHPHGIDPGVMSYSQPPYHSTSGMPNAAGSTQLHDQPQPQMGPGQQPQQHPHHHAHPQQQPLTQAANFVNVGTFTSGPYNQYHWSYGMGGSGRSFAGQSAGYGSRVASKDHTAYSGSGSPYRRVHVKRPHFNGYTAGVFPNHVRPPPVFGKVNHTRPPFVKPGFEQNQSDRRRGNHSRGKGGTSRGQCIMNNGTFDESKGKNGGSCSDKDTGKAEVNKFVGTEVLDDICRRLAATNVQKKSLTERSSSPSSSSSTQAENTTKCKEAMNSANNNTAAQCAKPEAESRHATDNKETNINGVVDSSATKATTVPNEKGSKGHSSSCTAQYDKVPNSGNCKGQPLATSWPQNNHRGYGGTCRYQQYPYRSGYHGQEMSRNHHHHRNNSSRNPNSRPKGSAISAAVTPSPASSSSPPENGGSEKANNQNPSSKVVSAPIVNGKAEGIKEKDASKGLDKPAKTAAEVLGDELSGSPDQVDDDRPMSKYQALLVDHLDPNNVLLSHLFVRGLIDRVLVDQVRRMKTRRDAMDVLFPALLDIPQDAVCAAFCDALHKSGQVYLAELIKSTGLAGDPMTEKHVAYLKLHQQNIAASMIPDKDLLVYLRTDSVLTSDLHRFISTQPSRAQQIDTLLQVLPFRGDKAFETFRTALRRSGQPWLAEQIAMELT